MTNREICEKEMDVLWNALLEADGGANNTMMSIASVMKDLILDLAAPVEEKKEGRDKNGRKCDKTDCRSCQFRPANTIPACDWPPVEQVEVPYKGVEKIVDPTGKNPTSYKCPFCNSYTITKTFRDIAGYLDGTCDHCGRTFTLTEEDKIL